MAGSGKSALAWMIKSTLAKNGIICDISGCEDEYAGIMDKEWKARLSTLKNQIVQVKTIRTKVKSRVIKRSKISEVRDSGW